MPDFEYIWLFVFLPLPILVAWLIPPHRERVEAVRVPMFARLSRVTEAQVSSGAVVLSRPWLNTIANFFIWTLLVAAAAKPVAFGDPVVTQKSARDMMLIIDLSQSMDTQDAKSATGEAVSRLNAVKAVMSEFVSKRTKDRLGLIFFGEAPYVQVPFTDDLEVVDRLMQEAVVGMAGPQTTLGDSIGMAIRLFRESEASQRVVILLTDGNDTGSFVPPLQAAFMASTEDIVIHVIGFGDPKAVGEEKLNEDVLKAIAQGTGGKYFFAEDQQGLSKIYTDLDRLEVSTFETQTFRPKRELFAYPLALALILAVVFQLRFWHLSRRRSA